MSCKVGVRKAEETEARKVWSLFLALAVYTNEPLGETCALKLEFLSTRTEPMILKLSLNSRLVAWI